MSQIQQFFCANKRNFPVYIRLCTPLFIIHIGDIKKNKWTSIKKFDENYISLKIYLGISAVALSGTNQTFIGQKSAKTNKMLHPKCRTNFFPKNKKNIFYKN